MSLPRCTLCDKPLTRDPVWLELDQRDDTYHDRRDVPDDKSQGWFPFGVDCANAKRREAALAKGAK